MKLLLLFCLLLTSVLADKHEHHFGRDLSYLKLTVLQKKDIKNILQSYRANIKRYKRLKKSSINKKEKLFKKEILDTKEIQKINHRLNQSSNNIEIQFLEQIHSVLSTKQRRQFLNYLDEWEIE